MFYFKNVRYYYGAGLWKSKAKHTIVSSNSVSLVWKRVACEENGRGLKFFAIPKESAFQKISIVESRTIRELLTNYITSNYYYIR